MAIKPDYETGTVSITNGTNMLSGINTFWVLAKIQKGDTFKVKNLDAIIEEVVSNTEITLKEAWTGGDLAASSYAIRYQPDGSRFAGAYVEIRDLLANGNLTAFASLVGALDLIPIFTGAGALTLIPRNDLIKGVETNEKVAILAERAAFDAEAKGFSVLVADVGDGRSAIYFKESSTSGDWSDPAFLTGPSGSFQSEGDWSAATAYEDGQVVSYQGSSWISLQDTNLNHAPPTLPTEWNAWWTILSRRGDGFTFRGDYVGATAYLKDDVVVNQNSAWIALQTTTGNAPPTLPTTSNAQWKLLVLGKTGKWRGDYVGGDTYIVGDTVLFNNSTWIAIAPTTGNAPPALPTTVNTWWQLQAAKGTGDVSGPATNANGNLALWDGVNSKTLKDGGPITAAGIALSNISGTPVADRLPYLTGASGGALTTLSSFARSVLDDTTGNAMAVTMGYVQGSVSQTWYVKLPGGLIVQWGSSVVTTGGGGGGVNIALAQAYTTSSSWSLAAMNGEQASGAILVSGYPAGKSAAGFLLVLKNSTTGTVQADGVAYRIDWVAVGV